MHKYGFHCNRTGEDVFDAIRRIKPPVVKALDHNVGFWTRVREVHPNVYLIGRLFVPNPEQDQYVQNPAGTGRALAERILGLEVNKVMVNGRRLFDAWESYNEVIFNGSSPDQRRAYDEFQVAFAAPIQAAGFEPIGMNCANGNLLGEDFLNDFRGTLETYRVLGFHEYDWPDLWRLHEENIRTKNEGGMWLALRYRRIMREVRKVYPNRHTVIITECGMTQGVMGGRNDVGPWHESHPVSEQQYWDSLVWYNRELQQDDYVKGACLFVVGAVPPWQSFEHLGGIVNRLEQLQAGNPPPVVTRPALPETPAPVTTPPAPPVPPAPVVTPPGGPTPITQPSTNGGAMATRTCKVGVHGRNDENFEEGDYQAIRDARIEVVKMMSHTRRDVFQRIKGENPGIEIITRLFHGGGFIEPGQFIQDMIPVMAQLQPFCTMFQIGNEPNHVARIEGWGAEDADARNFNQWFLQVYAALKQAHPWAQLGFPGLAVPDGAHRDRAWLQICRDAINKADWLGCHCYWQSPPGGGSVMLEEHSGLCFKYYHAAYPDKVIHILECGNSNGQNPAFPTDENLYADEYVRWLNEVFKHPYIGSASFFLLSSPDPNWRSFAWRRNGHMTSIVSRIGGMPRPELRPVSTTTPPVTQPPVMPPVSVPSIGLIPNVFTNQHLINAFFFLAGELGLKGDDLMASAGLNVGQLAANEQTRQLRYAGTPVDNLPGLADDVRTRIKANLVRELRNSKRWSGVVNAPAGLNLRAQPSTTAAVLLGLTNQTALEVLNEDDPQSEWLLVATAEGAAGFVARKFVTRTDIPMPAITTHPQPSGQPVQGMPGFFCSDPELANVPLAASGIDEIPLGANAGNGARRLAGIWNRYGGLLKVLAGKLGIDPGVAVAVLAVESGGFGFANGRMIIRFENHLFFGEWGKDHPDQFAQHFTFGSPSWQGHTWRPNPNQPFQEFHGNQDAEWQVLTFAAGLEDTVAKRSISMGAPQILGRNHARIGYSTVQDMFNAFSRDERAHILGLFDFIRADAGMVQALRTGDYVTFASGYNGPGQAQHYANLITETLRGFEILRTAPAMASFTLGADEGAVLDPELDAAISFLPMPQPPGMLIEVATTATPAAAAQPEGLPMPETATVPAGQPAQPIDQDLLAAWRKHVEQGLENNNIMFNRVLRAFMTPYYLTVVMYVLLFLVGIGLFVVAAWLSYAKGADNTVYFFGGLGVITFLAFFVSKPLRSLEENLQFITWLGIVYNTYWTRLLYMQDIAAIHTDLKDATSGAELSIEKLIDKNTALSKERPGFSVR